MSHYRILIAHKDKDFRELLDRNMTGMCGTYCGPDEPCDPFGYDYLVEESEPIKVKDALKDQAFLDRWLCEDGEWAFAEIIQEDESLYCSEMVGDETERKSSEAMAMLNPEYYCTVFRGHL